MNKKDEKEFKQKFSELLNQINQMDLDSDHIEAQISKIEADFRALNTEIVEKLKNDESHSKQE